LTARSHTFTSRGWLGDDGDPARPQQVLGVPVIEQLATRPDAPGALVRLADRRFALTGPTVAAGLSHQLDRHIQRRAARGAGSAWYAEARRVLRTVRRTGSEA
jgi:hypothetical protein